MKGVTSQDLTPRSTGTYAKLSRVLYHLDQVHVSQIDCDSVSYVRASRKACVTTATNGKFDGTDPLELIGFEKERNGTDNVRRGSWTNNTGRLDLTFLG
ncbi:MAG: hypothetical protein Q9197_004522 [Variospora fuerteventurae]